MTVAIIVLSIALAGSIAAHVIQAASQRSLVAARMQDGLALLAEARRADELLAARDAAVVRAESAEARGAEYARRLEAAEDQRNQALAQEGNRAAEAVTAAGNPLDVVNGVLQGSELRPVREAHPAAASGDRGAAGAVQPAAGAAGPATGRRP